MMRGEFDLTIRINSEDARVVVEQRGPDGTVSTKNISPESLSSCIQNSMYDETEYASGLLPEGCIGVKLSQNCAIYFVRYPELYADFTYQKTEYPQFPIPRLVFAFRYMPEEGKVSSCGLCAVKDEKLSLKTPTFWYPFSNVSDSGGICTGNNVLPVYPDPSRLHTLAGYILRLPNSNDYYRTNHNRLHAEFRDLLEHMKDKGPEHYYSDILVENGQTLGDFLTRR